MRWAWVRELRNRDKVQTKKVPADRNKADMLTKCLPAYKFGAAMKLMQGDQRRRHMAAFMKLVGV